MRSVYIWKVIFVHEVAYYVEAHSVEQAVTNALDINSKSQGSRFNSDEITSVSSFDYVYIHDLR